MEGKQGIIELVNATDWPDTSGGADEWYSWDEPSDFDQRGNKLCQQYLSARVWIQYRKLTDANHKVWKAVRYANSRKSSDKPVATDYARNLLEIQKFNDKSRTEKKVGKTILVIMQNPSDGLNDYCDRTLGYLVDYLPNDYTRIIVANATPVVTTKPKYLSTRGKATGLRLYWWNGDDDQRPFRDGESDEIRKRNEAQVDSMQRFNQEMIHSIINKLNKNSEFDIFLATGELKASVKQAYESLLGSLREDLVKCEKSGHHTYVCGSNQGHTQLVTSFEKIRGAHPLAAKKKEDVKATGKVFDWVQVPVGDLPN
ncbi:hypothetical protein [Lacticaseibacillus sp. GG6-2]